MMFQRMRWMALIALGMGGVLTSAAVLGRQEAVPSKEVATPHSVGGRADDPRSRKILEKLEEPISMSFANETPLEDVLKYIKQATTTKTYNGLPIYVDPVGLQEAERSLQSTIQIDLEGIPLRRTLQLILSQLQLSYFVEDGVVVITSIDSIEDRLPPAIREPIPILERAKRAARGELSLDEMKQVLEVLKLRDELEVMASSGCHGTRSEDSKARLGTQSSSGPTTELIKEVRELIQLLKAEMHAKRPAEAR